MGKIILLLFRILHLLYRLIMHSSIIIATVYLTVRWDIWKITKIGEFNLLLSIGMAYLLLAGIYFLKGMMIALKKNNNILWVIWWSLCVALISFIPAVVAFFIGRDWLIEHMGMNAVICESIAGIFSIILIYLICKKYTLNEDISQRWVLWAYKLGFKSIIIFYKKPRYNDCNLDKLIILEGEGGKEVKSCELLSMFYLCVSNHSR